MRKVILILLLCLPACHHAVPPEPTDQLLTLIRDRLELMHDVARRKWVDKSPIEDPAREMALLSDVAQRGAKLRLDPRRTRAFFAAQIEAAKLVQRADFQCWETKGPDGAAPDLKMVLRPRIDTLNREMLTAFANVGATDGAATRKRANELLSGFDDEVRQAAIAPLLK
jgi:chorismate mutase